MYSSTLPRVRSRIAHLTVTSSNSTEWYSIRSRSRGPLAARIANAGDHIFSLDVPGPVSRFTARHGAMLRSQRSSGHAAAPASRPRTGATGRLGLLDQCPDGVEFRVPHGTAFSDHPTLMASPVKWHRLAPLVEALDVLLFFSVSRPRRQRIESIFSTAPFEFK